MSTYFARFNAAAETQPRPPFGLDWLSELFCRSPSGTFVDGGAGIGLWTLEIAREEFVACKAFEADSRNFSSLADNVRHNCPNGNVEIVNADALALDGHLNADSFRRPIAVRLDSDEIDRAIAGAARLLEAADVAVLSGKPRSAHAIEILSRAFKEAAAVSPQDHAMEWLPQASLVPPRGDFEILLRK